MRIGKPNGVASPQFALSGLILRRHTINDWNGVETSRHGFCMPGRLAPPASSQLLRQPQQYAFGAADVAEAVGVAVLDHFADEFGAVAGQPFEGGVQIGHGEHDAGTPGR